jgi:hypothetical protein
MDVAVDQAGRQSAAGGGAFGVQVGLAASIRPDSISPMLRMTSLAMVSS